MKYKLLALGIVVLMMSCNHSTKETKMNNAALSFQDKKDLQELGSDLDVYNLDDWDDWDENLDTATTKRETGSLLSDDDFVGTTPNYMDRKMRIINLKRELGMQMKAIGMDRSIPGYEKGMRKRALKMKFRQELHKLLGENPTLSTSGGDLDFSTYNKLTYDIEAKLDALEDEYDIAKDKLEAQEDYMGKAEYKAKKNALKAKYKMKKAELKRKKDEVIYNELYR